MSNSFEKLSQSGQARRGRLNTRRGVVQTPAFMPVATQASVKGVNTQHVSNCGFEMVLSNTYHLALRPGAEMISSFGGLHKFMNWSGPILTDSGGFQVYSLAKLRKLSDDGVAFQSHIDGARHFFTPERVVEVQQLLDVDVLMVLDECLPYPATQEQAERSLSLTTSWARRSAKVKRVDGELLFGIMQGGMYPELRERASRELIEIGFDGYAIGGLSVGEPTQKLHELCEISTPLLPEDSIRYLMGVGTPSDIVKAVRVGVDLFDCVMPTRSARFGRLFTGSGHINIKNAKFREDPTPISAECDCYTCRHYSKAYLSHLLRASEPLFIELASVHNLRFYGLLMDQIRLAIEDNCYVEFAENYLSSREDISSGDTLELP